MEDGYLEGAVWYSEDDVASADRQGITLKNGYVIKFDECVRTWSEVYGMPENMRCVGDRDITEMTFMFFTLPRPVIIRFRKESRIREFFSRHGAEKRFHEFQLKITELGCATFDVT